MLGGVKNFSVGICDGAPSTAHSSYYLGLFWKSLALMTGCILYQLKVLSVKLGGVMSQNLDSK